MIKLIVVDIDGVMTDGSKIYGLDGLPFAKVFNDKDFTSLKRFRAIGIPVAFLTAGSGPDLTIAKNLSKNRDIPLYATRDNGQHKTKIEFLEVLMREYNVLPSDILYIGDDIMDIEMMKAVGYAFCPNDAPVLVQQYAKVLSVPGGNNVIQALFQYLESIGTIPLIEHEQIARQLYEADTREKF